MRHPCQRRLVDSGRQPLDTRRKFRTDGGKIIAAIDEQFGIRVRHRPYHVPRALDPRGRGRLRDHIKISTRLTGTPSRDQQQAQQNCGDSALNSCQRPPHVEFYAQSPQSRPQSPGSRGATQDPAAAFAARAPPLFQAVTTAAPASPCWRGRQHVQHSIAEAHGRS